MPERPTTTVARWNRLHPVGTPVIAYPGARPEDDPNGTRLVTRTRSAASVLGGHTAVVWVEGHGACIALSHVDPDPARFPALAVACPSCGSPAGQLCTSHSGTRPRRNDVHQTRTATWRAQPAPATTEVCTVHGPGCRVVTWTPTAPPAPDRATEFELRGDTEIRAAALREAAALLVGHASVLESLSSSDYDNEAFAASHLRTKAVDLHRLAGEAQPETEAGPETVAHLAPQMALLAALTVAMVLVLREGRRGRTRPGHGQQRPHSRCVGTADQDHAALNHPDRRHPMSYPQLLTPEEKLAQGKTALGIRDVVVLCGSMRFADLMAEVAIEQSVIGALVLKPDCNMKRSHPLWADPAEAEALKTRLDDQHKQKIRLADRVIVVGDYIGDSTRSEIAYARQLGKPITYTHASIELSA